MLYGNNGKLTEDIPFEVDSAAFMSPKFSSLFFMVSAPYRLRTWFRVGQPLFPVLWLALLCMLLLNVVYQ